MSTYKEIEEKYKRLDSFVEELEETFSKVDIIGLDLASRNVTTPDLCSGVLQELTGIYIYLTPIATIASMGEKIAKEYAFDDFKAEKEKVGEKVVATIAERESNLSALPNKIVVNKIESYMNACKLAIGVCQSLLKRMEEERALTSATQ